jgi:hypothetical protein
MNVRTRDEEFKDQKAMQIYAEDDDDELKSTASLTFVLLQ